jgi:hypothetical protein
MHLMKQQNISNLDLGIYTMNKLLNIEEVAELAKKAVAERGEDFVYPDEWKSEDNVCLYKLPNGEPGCIVGYMFPNYYFIEGEGASENLTSVVVDRFAGMYLNVLQGRQDIGNTWGEALRIANAQCGVN